jgi:pimeloyl-ACP methyl ester carboxylesterase
MPVTTNGRVKLHWDAAGQGTPVLLIMGHRYSSAMWYPVRDVLAARHRVIWFDNRGTGGSDPGAPCSMGDLARDALAVMDAAGVDAAHVYGVSMGGVIAQEVAMQQPGRVKSLILGCTGMLTPEKPRTNAFIRMLYYLPAPILKLLMRRGDHGYGSAAPADRVAEDEAMLADDPFSVRGVAGQAAAIAGHTVTAEQVCALTMPALVLHGDEDRTVPFSYGVELAETLPKAELVKLQGAGHNLFVARGVEANAAVLDFLGRVDASAA